MGLLNLAQACSGAIPCCHWNIPEVSMTVNLVTCLTYTVFMLKPIHHEPTKWTWPMLLYFILQDGFGYLNNITSDNANILFFCVCMCVYFYVAYNYVCH